MLKNLLASRKVVQSTTWILGILCLGVACASIDKSTQTEGDREPSSVTTQCSSDSDANPNECKAADERQNSNDVRTSPGFDLRVHRE